MLVNSLDVVELALCLATDNFSGEFNLSGGECLPKRIVASAIDPARGHVIRLERHAASLCSFKTAIAITLPELAFFTGDTGASERWATMFCLGVWHNFDFIVDIFQSFPNPSVTHDVMGDVIAANRDFMERICGTIYVARLIAHEFTHAFVRSLGFTHNVLKEQRVDDVVNRVEWITHVLLVQRYHALFESIGMSLDCSLPRPMPTDYCVRDQDPG